MMRVATLTCDQEAGEARDMKLSREFAGESPSFRMDVLLDILWEVERHYNQAFDEWREEGKHLRANARRKKAVRQAVDTLC
jgi:hypothetical protein